MKNPYQSPSSSLDVNSVAQSHESVLSASVAGLNTAVRWVTIIVAPIFVIVFIGLQIFFVYRGITVGIWPEYSAPQFWYSMVVLALLLIASYVVVCFLAGLFAAVAYSVQHLFGQKHTKPNAE